MDLTETLVGRENLADGVLLKAYRDTVKLPDGKQSIREWIDHPGASAIVPLFADGDTILLRQFRYPAGREFWEVPAGKLDATDVSPDDVARRELEEETGFKAETFTRLHSIYPCIGYSNEVIHFYLAENLSPSEAVTDHDEFLEPVRLPLAEAMAMLAAGKIDDMKTLTALFLVDRHLANRG